MTVGAGLVNDLTGAPALLAGALALHDAKGRPLGLGHGAGAAAVGAHLRRGAMGAAVAFAGGAGLAALHRHGFLAAEGGLREVHGHAGPDALAPAGSAAPLLAAAEAAAEEAAENVAQVAEIEAACPVSAALARAIVGVHPGEAELVIFLALIGIGQHLVGLVDLLELLLGLLVAGVHVRVILPGQLFVCFFDLVLAGALFNAQDLVIISFVCHKGPLPSPGVSP